MAIFIVMEPPRGDAETRAERAVLVRDGFSFLAFVFSIPWLLAHRLWIEAGLVFAASIAIAAAGSAIGTGLLATVLSLALSTWIGLEANRMRVDALARRGWREWGPVEGQTRDEAETRYACALTDGIPVTPVAITAEPRHLATFGRQTDLFAVAGSR